MSALVLRDVRVFTGTEVLEEATVVIEAAWITSVGAPPAALPSGAVVVECAGRTVIPGLVDAHAHLVFREGRDDWYSFELAPPVERAMLDGVLNAERLLRMGVTAVRDVGTRGNVAVLLRDAISAGELVGPRVRAAKQVISVWGGHEDHHPSHLFRDSPYPTGVGELISGPWQARDAVRRQVKDGVDWVKVEASGTAANPFCPGDRDTISDEELAAVVDEARLKGRPVACHAESRTSIVRAARAGVATIEHCVDLGPEGLEAILEREIAVCPTVEIYANLARTARAAQGQARPMTGLDRGTSPGLVEEYERRHELHVESIRRAWQAGVTIVAGSDAGSARFPHDGALASEIASYVELIGMSEAQALICATAEAARVIGLGEDLGTLAAGKRADLLVYAENPLEDIHVLSRPESLLAVVKDGTLASGSL